ncbi:hypothetical protein CK203_078945 [Vitis vinifera]|uniref:Integrase catalytic domain-containing protein n=1 Tax=Vitis vinifera TaxID=29760 RepID=A0A438D9X3_VITVI|nr:hypothetical protein CK203_078945 [Vitis vinifera]
MSKDVINVKGMLPFHICHQQHVEVSLRPMAFAQWGMDIVGPLPAAPAQKKFLLVATDYFSKWVEAEAYASIKDKDVTKFVWKNIVCRFGIPQTIIADNGPQFDSIAFRNFYSELNIRNSYSTPRYPQKVVEELPGVLWAYRTTPGRPTGNTPFALAYGMDAVIPTEIGLPTIRTDAAKQNDANTELGRNLDWADEVRESAAIRMADYQQRASAHYNRKVKPRSFKNANSRSSSSFCAVKRSCKSSFCFFSIEASVRSCLTPPSAGPSHPLPHAGASIDSSRLFAQPNPPEGLILPERWINWLRPPPVSGAADLHYFCAETRRPSYNQWASGGASRVINKIPPDEATEGDSCSGFGASTFTTGWVSRVQPHPGPSGRWSLSCHLYFAPLRMSVVGG